MSSSAHQQREQGWGAYEKAQRYRQAEEKKRIVKHDANDPFTFKRPTRQQPPQQQQQQQQQAPPQQQQQAPPPQALPAAPVASPAPVSAAPAFSDDDEPTEDTMQAEQKYPTTSPTAAKQQPQSGGAVSPMQQSSNTTQVLCSMLVELFEMVSGAGNPAPKAFGPKGITLQCLPFAVGNEPSFQLLVFAPVSKKTEFCVDVTPSVFSFTVLPDRFATFEDVESGRNWCIKFGTSEDAYNMARCFALVNEVRAVSSFARGGSRGIIRQDLAVGAVDNGPAVAIGDQIKCKYSVYAHDPAAPFFIGRVLFSTRESTKYIVGAGAMPIGVEESLVGMRKKGARLLVIPPTLSNAINEDAEWGPHVKHDTTLIIEVTVSNVRSSLPVNDDTAAQDVAVKDSPAMHAPAVEQQAQPQQQQQQQPQQSPPPQNPPSQLPLSHVASLPAAPVAEEEERGVYNPTSIPAQADLKSRMAALANASHSNGVVANRRDSFGGAAPASSPSANADPSEPTLESLLSDLQLSELLPRFTREGVTLPDLVLLDADELKQLVPLMGPRRRISGRIAEMQQQQQQPKVAPTTPVQAAPAHASPVRQQPIIQQPQQPAVSAAYRARAASIEAREAAAQAATSSHGSKHYSQITSQQQLEALLAAEYERGKADTIALAKGRISEMKETAGARFQSLQLEVQQANERNEADREKAREMVQRLREDLRSANAARDQAQSSLAAVTVEKDHMSEKTQKYVAQIKARYEQAAEQASQARATANADEVRGVLLASLEQLYTGLTERVRPKDLYEGEELLGLVKTAVKNIVRQH